MIQIIALAKVIKCKVEWKKLKRIRDKYHSVMNYTNSYDKLKYLSFLLFYYFI